MISNLRLGNDRGYATAFASFLGASPVHPGPYFKVGSICFVASVKILTVSSVTFARR